MSRMRSHMVTAGSDTLVLNVIMRPNYNAGVGAAVYCTLLIPSTSAPQPIFTPQRKASVSSASAASSAKK